MAAHDSCTSLKFFFITGKLVVCFRIYLILIINLYKNIFNI